MKVNNVWVISEQPASVCGLVSAAKELGEHVVLVYAGEKTAAVGADKAYWLGDMSSDSFVNYIPAIVELVKSDSPELVLTGVSANDRLAGSAIAAALRCAVFSDVSELNVSEDGVVAKRMVYGGAAFKTEKSNTKTTVVVLPAGLYEEVALDVVADIAEVNAVGGVTLVEKKVVEKKASNLPSAKRVISVGRGVGTQELLDTVKQLADVLECEIGCTRPMAEDLMLMPKDTYIGISGLMLKPNLYIGIGLSGQIHHMIGINTSKTIVAINKDKSAPVFSDCDYGIVANLEDVIPALIEKLK